MTAAITVHYRRPDLTMRCVESLLQDGWIPVVVWDNSEDDGVTIELLKERYAHDGRVRIIGSGMNLGFGSGINSALADLACQGHLGSALIINNDAYVLPGMREALYEASRGCPAPAIVAPKILQDGRERGWLHYQPWLALVAQKPLLGSLSYLSGCCLFVSCADKCEGLFDESFFMYGEDVELSWRWRREGGKLILLDQVWVHHKGSASTGMASDAYERALVFSHWLLAEKLSSNALERWLMKFLRVPVLLLRGLVRALRYGSWTPLRALRAPFSRLV